MLEIQEDRRVAFIVVLVCARCHDAGLSISQRKSHQIGNNSAVQDPNTFPKSVGPMKSIWIEGPHVGNSNSPEIQIGKAQVDSGILPLRGTITLSKSVSR